MRMDCQAGTGLRVNWTELQTNLVPKERLRYITPSLAPLLPPAVSRTTQPRVDQLMYHAFKHTNQLAKCDLQHQDSRLMGCCMLFRGDTNPFQVHLTCLGWGVRASVTFVTKKMFLAAKTQLNKA